MRLVDALVHPLEDCPEWQPFWALLDSGEDALCGVARSARPFLISARFARTPQPTLVVVASQTAVEDMARNLSFFLGEEKVLVYPERTDYPWSEKAADPSVIARHHVAFDAISRGRDVVVVASARELLRKMAPPASNAHAPLELFVDEAPLYQGQRLNYEELVSTIESMGYVNTVSLEGPGSFALHGGAIDIFAGNLTYPLRLDFFGDEVEDLRRIVPGTGQTISSVTQTALYPVRDLRPSHRALSRARDVLHNPAKTNPVLREMLENLEGGVWPENASALLPYLYEKPGVFADYLSTDVLTVLDEPRSLIDDALHAYDDLLSRSQGTSMPLDRYYVKPTKLDFGANQRATYESIMRAGAKLDAEMPVKRTDVAGDPEKLFGRLRSFVEGGYTTVLSVSNYRAREDVKLELVDRSIPISEVLDCQDCMPKRLDRHVVNVTDVPVSLGFVLPKAKLAIVSISDTQGASSVRATKRVDVTDITFPYAPGDYVVHAAHGIAFFKDIVRQEVGGVQRDYLLLEYAEQDKLYVPVEQLDRVTRYVGPEGSSPRLTRLNTSDWSRALSRARKSSRKLAFDLVDVYARRAAAKGYAYGPDTPWQRQMEDDFPYDETADQLLAIADVKADMQSPRPMDRLVCGDVGFGKTEVALRAAFKATQDGKQVMVLCPTTILAQQHYTTFTDRFNPYEVNVEVLSRFRTPQEQRKALEGFADGSVDVLVGTHRLLSRDVNPRDLGLVIIDEEQRFGVGHKEQLKNLRESIDVLTLSATPIPRTMQMSLSGVRDMSLILTPPDDRRPVEVHVGEWDPDLVSDAIERELARGGQVYYVSNRVLGIEDAVGRVQAAAPSARVGVAHGKMSKDELEGVMEDFAAAAIDVLVATTIIESGIDNPHTNTLIIEDSQRLGLAQMYQLKGRVGRSSRQAYAYFMFPEQMPLTEEAVARLTAINEHQDLGSGMRVAMRDLEIRGAGTMLGAEQSGNMSAVGFDLFAQMLATAVNSAREGTTPSEDLLPEALSDIAVNLPAHAYLPEEYVPDTDERVLLYRKAASAFTVQDVENLRLSTEQRHGDMPQAARNYFTKAAVKALAHDLGIKSISLVAGKVNFEPVAKPSGTIWDALRTVHARYISQSRKLVVPVAYFDRDAEGSINDAVRAFLEQMVDEKER